MSEIIKHTLGCGAAEAPAALEEEGGDVIEGTGCIDAIDGEPISSFFVVPSSSSL